MVKIEGLFSDYDGTLSPLEVARGDAAVSPRLRRLLTKTGKRIPIGIVTTKDLGFVRDKVPFAHGISAVSGLEIQIDDRIMVDERAQASGEKIEKAHQEALNRILHDKDTVVVEAKTTEDDELVGFCVDWRMAKDWAGAREKVAPFLDWCRKEGLYVAESDVSPFVNIYGAEVDKGSALQKLRSELYVKGPIIYLGDSEADNPAFDLAEVSVGVKHHKVTPELTCKYELQFFELESFIMRLLDADLEFSEDMLQKYQRTV